MSLVSLKRFETKGQVSLELLLKLVLVLGRLSDFENIPKPDENRTHFEKLFDSKKEALMEPIEQLEVHLRFTDTSIPIGQMVIDNGTIFFKYEDDFLSKGLTISPFKPKRSDAILTPETNIFDKLFGVFSDSLPDGWVRLLLDRKLSSKRISINQITPLDRLAYVGSSCMGHCSKKSTAFCFNFSFIENVFLVFLRQIVYKFKN